MTRRWLGTVLLFSVALGSAGAADGGNATERRYGQARERSIVTDEATFTAGGPVNLGAIEKTVDLPIPFVGDAWEIFDLLIVVQVLNGVPDGRMNLVVSRMRDGKIRRMKRMTTRFRFVNGGTDPPTGGALALTALDPAKLQAGDVVSLAFTFDADHPMRRGDSMSYWVQWDARDKYAVGATETTDATNRAARDKLVIGDRFARQARVQDYLVRGRTPLDRVRETVDLWIPDYGDGTFSDEIILALFSSVVPSDEGSTPSIEHATGRLKTAFFHYPADGGPREILGRSSTKLDDGPTSSYLTVKTPAGFGGGDRIAVEVSFRSDYRFPRGEDSWVSLTGQALLIDDR